MIVCGAFWLKPLREAWDWNGDCEATLPALRSKKSIIEITAAIGRLSQTVLEIISDNEGIEDPDPKITLTLLSLRIVNQCH